MNGRYLTGWCPSIEKGAVIVSLYTFKQIPVKYFQSRNINRVGLVGKDNIPYIVCEQLSNEI